MKSKLFVYGTLMKQSSHPMAAFLLDNAKLLGEAKMKGELYRISWYPGAVYNPKSSFNVSGALYEINNEEQLLNELDKYEGVGEQFAQPNEYTRIKVPILFNNELVISWVYNYIGSINTIERIESGKWM